MFNKKSTRNIAKLMCLTLCASAVAAPLIACGDSKSKRDNEKTPLVLATDVLDSVFNPFFYTSGSDGEIVAQTQIGMLSSNEKGEMTSGWNEPCVVHDYSQIQHGTSALGDDYDNYYTDYYFAIKDNIKFSDGELLTKNDVLFNIYMYLDPAYTGSSTMYSVKIKGLEAYRNNDPDAGSTSGTNNTEEYYKAEAGARINKIVEWAEEEWGEDEKPWEYLSDYEFYTDGSEDVIEKDILMAHTFFKEELDQDWVSAQGVDWEKEYAKYKDGNGKLIVDSGWKVFLFRYGILKCNPHYDKNGKIDYYDQENTYPYSDVGQSAVTQYVFDSMLGSHEKASESYRTNLVNVISYYATSATLYNYIYSQCRRHDLTAGERKVDHVEGIEFLTLDAIPTKSVEGGNEIVNGSATAASFPRALKDADGNAKSFDVLHIRINGVDPKAIQNFAFTVAPGHYYSPIWNEFDAEKGNFGVKFLDPDFMRGIKENHLPLGAGPYRAATEHDGIPKTKTEFFKDNGVYMVRNDYFLLGKPKIKKLRYKVIANNMLYNAVKTGEVNYASPSMDFETIQKLESTDRKILDSANAWTLGYGYIGISAQYIPNIYIRRAIMHTLDPQMCVTYYGGNQYATVIQRPMSKTLENYYPDEATPYYEYYLNKEGKPDTAKILAELTGEGGCKLEGGKLTYKGKALKYTFTVAGDSDDHPANAMLENSAEILKKIGFDITVSHDSTALSKLAAGTLTVWAAAWSSSSDPDMYQVYHKSSSATSTLAWGYRYLLSSECDAYQRGIVNDLAELIEEGRDYLEPEKRKPVYTRALDKLMELAVEFPTYQRKNYYVWQKGLFDTNTIYTDTDVSPYRSPLSDIWNVQFNKG